VYGTNRESSRFFTHPGSVLFSVQGEYGKVIRLFAKAARLAESPWAAISAASIKKEILPD
jgi:hypothetical protein